MSNDGIRFSISSISTPRFDAVEEKISAIFGHSSEGAAMSNVMTQAMVDGETAARYDSADLKARIIMGMIHEGSGQRIMKDLCRAALVADLIEALADQKPELQEQLKADFERFDREEAEGNGPPEVPETKLAESMRAAGNETLFDLTKTDDSEVSQADFDREQELIKDAMGAANPLASLMSMLGGIAGPAEGEQVH